MSDIDWNIIGAAMRKHNISGDIAPLESESQFIARIIDETARNPGLEVMQQCGGDVWGQCEAFPRSDWRQEVDNGDTNLGYWDWVVHEVDVTTLRACD